MAKMAIQVLVFIVIRFLLEIIVRYVFNSYFTAVRGLGFSCIALRDRVVLLRMVQCLFPCVLSMGAINGCELLLIVILFRQTTFCQL